MEDDLISKITNEKFTNHKFYFGSCLINAIYRNRILHNDLQGIAHAHVLVASVIFSFFFE